MTGQEKFDTCVGRSKNKVPLDGVSLSGCGACSKNKITEGYTCFRTGLEDIKPEICEGCKKYKEKTIYGS